MTKTTTLLLFLALITLGCSGERTTYEITEINAKIKFPGKPTVTSNGNRTNVQFANDELIYCLEFENFDKPRTIQEIWESHLRIYEYDSERQANCLNSNKVIVGGDTTTYDEIAGLVMFKDEQTPLVSTGYYHITPNWRLSIELGILNLDLTPEQRRTLRDELFSTEPIKSMYDEFSKGVYQDLETYNVEAKWR